MEKKIKLKPASVSAYSERVILQILFKHGGWAHFCSDRFVIRAAELALALGLPSDLKLEEMGTLKAVRAALQARYQALKLKRQAQPDKERIQLEKNLLAVAASLHLSEVELAILRLAAYMQIEQPLKDALNLVGNQIDRRRFCNLLAGLVQQPFDAIRVALNEQEKLMRFGLLDRNRHNRDFDDHLQWGEALDVDKLDVHPFSEEALLKRVLTASAPSSLNWKDFEHIAPMANRARDYLNAAYQTHRKGVNLLLYGAPGTGKTEFASLLAQQLNVACFTLSSMDEDEDLLSGKRKLKSAQLAQALLLGQRALLIFDEVEDVFAGDLFRRSVAQEHKAWMNQFLESNVVPMVWISNDVHCMDDAFIRRFDLVIEMPDIPYQNKLSLIKSLSSQQLE
ncbi:MAG: ATP-binding protein [Brachymonas sp.]|nr:ATP-binding protein [Brachymonas sp.]